MGAQPLGPTGTQVYSTLISQTVIAEYFVYTFTFYFQHHKFELTKNQDHTKVMNSQSFHEYFIHFLLQSLYNKDYTKGSKILP